MPSVDPSKAAARPDVYVKKVTWLELFFDVLFALALAMSAKPLESITGFSGDTFCKVLEFSKSKIYPIGNFKLLLLGKRVTKDKQARCIAL